MTQTTDQIVLAPERFQKLLSTLNALELTEAKGRMALEDANSRVEQLEDILSAIKDYAASYAEYNPTYEQIVQMCEEAG